MGIRRPTAVLAVLCTVAGGALLWSAPALALLDGRAWELVSPPNKLGAGIEAMTQGGGVIQAAEDGSAIAYVANGPIVASPVGNRAPEPTQVLSRRIPGGWETQDLQTPRNPTVGRDGGLRIGAESEYQIFSSDLSLGLVEPVGDTPLPPLPEDAEESVYLRHSASGEYQPLVTAANVLGGATSEFGRQLGKNGNPSEGVIAWGASPDLSHVVLQSFEVPLLAGASQYDLYEWAEGQLRIVSVLPQAEGGAAVGGALGRENAVIKHAISNDGSRVLWSSGGGILYLRDMSRGETVRVSPGDGQFQTASSDGSRVFFTEEGELYAFTLSAGSVLAGTVANATGSAEAAVQGDVLGADEGASYVYFFSTSVLSEGENGNGEKAVAGEDNLYVGHYDSVGGEWVPRFIATLSGEDAQDWNGSRGEPGNLTFLTARVSPDGRYLAFMSERSLTGYDNHGAESGEPNEEVFLYDAVSGHLVCASCAPSGARPVGFFDPGNSNNGPLIDHPGIWSSRWLSGSIPGWTPLDVVHSIYQSRYLSDSGRLFFQGADGLVPADVNGREDVYEYEPEGMGSCRSTSETAGEVFSQQAKGCVGLISAGISDEESAFLDASDSGEDVFFLTTSHLAPQDIDGAFDVYDAHVCSGASPCQAPGAVPPPACGDAAACEATGGSSSGATFEVPVSATFAGVGNGSQAGPAGVPTAAPRRSPRVQKLTAALRVCRRKTGHKRAVCEARAHRRYGAKAKRAKAVTRRGK